MKRFLRAEAYLFKTLCLVVCCLTLIASHQQPVHAITAGALNSLVNRRPFYNPLSCLAPTASADSTPSTPTGAPGDKLKNFVDKYGQSAYDNSIKSGVPYEFTLAQGIVEGGFDSDLAVKYHNLFGIKAGGSWTGPTVSMRTREQRSDGSSYYIMADFRVYASDTEGFAGHDSFLRTNKRYAPAFTAFEKTKDPMQFLIEVKKAGYATANNYVQVVGGVLKQIQDYISTTHKWPPSSQVVYQIDPAYGTTSSGGTGTSSTGSSCNGATASDGGVSIVGNFTFPLKTTKAILQKGVEGSVWCYTNPRNCHHDYNAADIHAPTGTQVLAAHTGIVVMARDTKDRPSESGSKVVILGDDGIVYYYAHMGKGTIKVAEGQQVAGGTQIGEVGTDTDAMNTPAHLHFDMQPPPAKNRPSCKASECTAYNFINPQPTLIEAFKGLPES